MLVLYGLYVVCTVALVAAAVGIARHIARHRREVRSQAGHSDEAL